MKISIVKQEKTFKPIVLNITIESEEELCALWHRMNIAGSTIRDTSQYSGTNDLKHDPTSACPQLLWRELDGLVIGEDLYK